jgi:MoaA/NifB/PqqE/SkfB family radical SAM enzyme
MIGINKIDRESGFAMATSSGNVLSMTRRVSFELSNLCNLAHCHKKCPLSLVQRPVILPTRIIMNVLATLHKHDFSGSVAFHTYNEPLIDPRLFMLISMVKEKCPKANIFISSNGYYLDQNLLNELTAAGVSEYHISAYSPHDFKRLSALSTRVPYLVELMKLDNRLSLYDAPERHNCEAKPCYAPLNEIIVTREGTISLCCLDWRRDHSFGDLHRQSFEQIMLSGELQKVFLRLRKGERYLNLCKRCDWSR